jgi:hypothetical protein
LTDLTAENIQPYTSRIIKASALIADTRLLLAEWDLDASVPANLERARRENIFGKASRKRVEDILVIFRQRYFEDEAVGRILATLVQRGAPESWITPLLYFFAAQADHTLHDIVTIEVYERRRAGHLDLPKEWVMRVLREWVAEGRTMREWGDATIRRVAEGILATLRDFGVLEGHAHKKIAPFYLPLPTFALVAFWLARLERSGTVVLTSDAWRLFFLPVEGVERLFIEAQQEGLLRYQAAGSVIRIEFPAGDLMEYTDVLLESAR